MTAPAADQLAAALERLERLRIGCTGDHPRRQQVRGAARLPARECLRLHRGEADDGRARARVTLDAVDLDERDAPLGHLRGNRAPHRFAVAAGDRGRRHLRGNPRGVGLDACFPLAIVVPGNLRRERRTSSIGTRSQRSRAAPNQLAADDQHEHRRHDRQAEHRQDQLGAEARERQAAPPLDNQLDDVARQHEHEHDEHRQIRGRDRVEDDFAQEVRVELGRTVRERHHRHQRRQQQPDAEQYEPGIVAEGAPLGGVRRTGRASPSAGIIDV